ncbi:MAG: hypothetical protein ACYCTB_09915 [bacterium]
MKNDNLLWVELKQLFALDVNLKKYILNVNADISRACSKNLNKDSRKSYNDNSLNYKKFWFYAESIGEVKIALYLCDLIKENIKIKNANIIPVFFISFKTASAYKILKSYNYINTNNIHNSINTHDIKSSDYNYNNSNNIIFFYHPVYFIPVFFKYYVNLIKPDYFISIEHSINNKYVEILFNYNKNVKIYLLDLNFKKERYLSRYNLLKKEILNNIYVNVHNKEDEINLENLFKSCKKIRYNNYNDEKEENKNDNADKPPQSNLIINDNIDKSSQSNLIINDNIDKSSQSNLIINDNTDKLSQNNLTILEISDYPLKTAASFNNFTKFKKYDESDKAANNKYNNKYNYDYKNNKNKLNIQNIIVISFVSVHKKEAVFLIGILKSLNEFFFDKNIKFKFIFAPRNIKIIKLIKKKAEKENFKVIFYKKDNIGIEKFIKSAAGTDILAIDDYGKLDEVYQVSDIVYVGKSLFKEESGGHNILEPILYSKAVITGPYINNFQNIANTYIRNNAIKIIEKENFLDEFIKFIENNKLRGTMGEISFNIFKEQQEKTAENLDYFIKNEFLN